MKTQQFIFKVWGTAMVAAPLLFVLLMAPTLSTMHHAYQETILVAFVTMFLGSLYYSLSLAVTLIIVKSLVKTNNEAALKLATLLSLLVTIAIESTFLYKYNLSMVYRGTLPMILSYLVLVTVASWVYKINPKTNKEIHPA